MMILYHSDIRDPLNLQKGWLLWAGVGLVGALASIAVTGAVLSSFNGGSTEREVINDRNPFHIFHCSFKQELESK